MGKFHVSALSKLFLFLAFPHCTYFCCFSLVQVDTRQMTGVVSCVVWCKYILRRCPSYYISFGNPTSCHYRTNTLYPGILDLRINCQSDNHQPCFLLVGSSWPHMIFNTPIFDRSIGVCDSKTHHELWDPWHVGEKSMDMFLTPHVFFSPNSVVTLGVLTVVVKSRGG